MSHSPPDDIIDLALGAAAAARLAPLRDAKPETRRSAQQSYVQLFVAPFEGAAPDAGSEPPSLAERLAVAQFTTLHYRSPALAAHYAARLRAEVEGGADLAQAVAAEVAAGLTTGPFGHHHEIGLRHEDSDGLRHAASAAAGAALGRRLAAFLTHAHLLIYRPREAGSADLQRLLDAGWGGTGIVTLSQAVAFLSFQTRITAGLAAFDAYLAAQGRAAALPAASAKETA